MIVDYGRGPYTAPCRWGEDGSGDGLIVWEIAQPDADVLPIDTAFGSSIWEGIHRELGQGAGELNRDGKRIRPVVSSKPGKHFHGDPQWYLTGVPASVLAGPVPLYVCGNPTANGLGGGAAGGEAVQTGNPYAVVGQGGGAAGGKAPPPPYVGQGGGAAGGTSEARGRRGQGGGAAGGWALQTGLPYAVPGHGGGAAGGFARGSPIVPRGGGAAGGWAPETGVPYASVGSGGGAGGGVADQTSPTVETACYFRALPVTMWVVFAEDANCAPNAGAVLPITYDGGLDAWLTGEFSLPGGDHFRVLLACLDSPAGWAWQLLQGGSAVTGGDGISVSADPFRLDIAAPPLSPCPMTIQEYHP